MQFDSQKEALAELKKLADSNRQSIVISGPSGTGKSYLCKEYANMISAEDFISISPKVAEIKEALDACIAVEHKTVLSIENLDEGVASASYTLLKTLEEPFPNLYIVITCKGTESIPDTIISRSTVVNLGCPTNSDIDLYGSTKDKLKFDVVASRLVWQCVKSFKDADEVLEMTSDEIAYYESLSEVCKFKDNVSNIVWKLGHYESNKECNIEFAIRSIMYLMKNNAITQYGIECLNDISKSRVAKHAVLAKFAFNAKYCS